MSDGYTILTLDEVETAPHRGSNLVPVRHHLGFHAAGLTTAVAVEMDERCCATLNANKHRG